MSKRNSITQYRPGFIDLGDTPLKVFEFDHLDELKDCAWVDLFTKHHDFHRFSVARSKPGRPTLMVERDEGKMFFVIGFFKYDVDLPTWVAPKMEE